MSGASIARLHAVSSPHATPSAIRVFISSSRRKSMFRFLRALKLEPIEWSDAGAPEVFRNEVEAPVELQAGRGGREGGLAPGRRPTAVATAAASRCGHRPVGVSRKRLPPPV